MMDVQTEKKLATETNKIVKDNNIKALRQIYTTNQYELFVLDKINRKITATKDSQDKLALEVSQPIEVMPTDDGKLMILDGQHRYFSRQKAGLPINFYVTLSGDDTTQGLRQRNQGTRWSSNVTIDSYASDDRNPEVQARYRELQDLLNYTKDKIGKFPLIPFVELTQGINRALDQSIVKSRHDFTKGLYETKNHKAYVDTIDKFNQMQIKLNEPAKAKASVLRGIFTLLSNDNADPVYLAKRINEDRPTFEYICVENNDVKVARDLFGLYNAKAPLDGKKTIAFTDGIDGLILKDKHPDMYLASERS